MRKNFWWACVGAALMGWNGLAYAGEMSLAEAPSASGFTIGDPAYGVGGSESSLDEALKDESAVELCNYGASCGCAGACGCADACGCAPALGNWFDNTVIFSGADIYKSIGDRLTNINGGTGSLTSSFGGVTGFNTGFALGDLALRGQFGASYGLYDPRGRLAIVPQSTDVEQQAFVTTGVYKRGDALRDDPWSYGTVVDAFMSDNWGINANEVEVGQVRGILGYALSERFEVGAFGTAHLWHDSAAVTVAGAPGVRREVRAANQMNGYLRGNTLAGGSLMGYLGLFDNADIQDWQFGLTGESPLSQYFSLYGNFNYAVPSARAGAAGSGEEQFNIQFGVAYFFGGKAASPSVTGQRGLPLLDVANNGSLLITD
jgi:hypothetical protein